MHLFDILKLSFRSLISQRLRSILTIIGIAVGIAAVVLLTSIGEGVHRYTLAEFTQFGTNLIGINPGRTTTFGTSGALINNIRPLSLEDEDALRHIPGVTATVSVVQGNSSVEYGKRSRRTTVLGVSSEAAFAWKLEVGMGRFLPGGEGNEARALVVLGSKVKEELFQNSSPLGKIMRVGGERYRVIGVMESKGQMLGFDMDDTVYIPVSRGMSLFNLHSLMEIDLLYNENLQSQTIAQKIKTLLINRHGEEDFTITTQDQMLETLGSILSILTMAVGGLGAISLFVGAVGIATIMSITVTERTPEIGLLCAIGATRHQILLIFLNEAVILAGLGGAAGLAAGASLAWLLGVLIPNLPTHTPWTYALYAELLSMIIGLLAGVLPARSAASMDPVEALRTE